MTETSLSKWEQAISKLVEFTQDGKLEWGIVNPKEYLPDDETTGVMLLVKYKDKHLILYQGSYTRISGNVFAVISGQGNEVEDFRPELSVYDVNEKVIVYTFPYSQLVEDLYKAATFSAAKIDELISSILSESSEKDRT